MIRRAFVRVVALVALVLATGSCQSETVTQPDAVACFLGPIELPTIPPICFTGRSGCPNPRPFGARTLVGLATCIDDVDPVPSRCTPKVDRCPEIDPNGNTTNRFLVARPGDACAAVVDVIMQASGDGGAGLEWRVQDYQLTGGQCVTKGGMRVGLSSMPGPCCSTELEIPVPERNRTFRLIARTDWLF